jgi:hypothetical protein
LLEVEGKCGKQVNDVLFAWTQLSWCMQQASSASHGASPGQPL